MSTATMKPTPIVRRTIEDFPSFDLERLLGTVFEPIQGCRVAILIDLSDTSQMRDFAFLQNPKLSVQRKAYEVFYQGLKQGLAEKLGVTGGEMFAYQETGGSNLDLPDEAIDSTGTAISLKNRSIHNMISSFVFQPFPRPLTHCLRKEFGFRGATLHGLMTLFLLRACC